MKKKNFWVLIYVKPNLVLSHFGGYGGGGGGGSQKIKVTQNGLKHIFVLEFLRSNEIFKIFTVSYNNTSQQATNKLY